MAEAAPTGRAASIASTSASTGIFFVRVSSLLLLLFLFDVASKLELDVAALVVKK
jgi:hypothetical protein